MAYAGELSALLTAVLWTGSALAFAAATVRVGSVYVNVTRLVFAVVLLFLAIFVLGIQPRISPLQIIYLALSGLVGFVFGDTFLFKSYEYNSARIGSLVMSAAPAFAALLAFFLLGETLTVTGILGSGTERDFLSQRPDFDTRYSLCLPRRARTGRRTHSGEKRI
jgi:drug/metabolite transporter (DMT)-like permease